MVVSGQKKLFLASASPIRAQLLREACIPFEIIEHRCCEDTVKVEMAGRLAVELVRVLARYKADSLVEVVRAGLVGDGAAYLIAADTVIESGSGEIFCKPRDKADAIAMIKKERQGMAVVTGFCCAKITEDTAVFIDGVETVTIELAMPDEWIERYLEVCPDALYCAGAVKGEGFGAQFWKSLHGEYTAAMGLPMTHVRSALETLGFFTC